MMTQRPNSLKRWKPKKCTIYIYQLTNQRPGLSDCTLDGLLDNCLRHLRNWSQIMCRNVIVASEVWVPTCFSKELQMLQVLSFFIFQMLSPAMFRLVVGRNVPTHPSYSPSSSSNSPSSSAVASWYCWYSETKSFMLDSASVNSISSIPSPVYQCKKALRQNREQTEYCCESATSPIDCLCEMRQEKGLRTNAIQTFAKIAEELQVPQETSYYCHPELQNDIFNKTAMIHLPGRDPALRRNMAVKYSWVELTLEQQEMLIFFYGYSILNSKMISLPSLLKTNIWNIKSCHAAATRLNISWIAVELPANDTAIFNPFGGMSHTDALMLFGIHSTK